MNLNLKLFFLILFSSCIYLPNITLAGNLLLYDCIKQEITKIKIKKSLNCNICK